MVAKKKGPAPTFFPVRFWGSTEFRGMTRVSLPNLQALKRDVTKLGFAMKIEANRRNKPSERKTYHFKVEAKRAGRDCPEAFRKAKRVAAAAKKHGVKFHKQAPVSMFRTTASALKRRAQGWGWKGITKCPVKGR